MFFIDNLQLYIKMICFYFEQFIFYKKALYLRYNSLCIAQ